MIRQAIHLTIGNLVSRCVFASLTIVVAKLVSPEQYGAFSYAIATVSLASYFCDLGLQSTYLREVAGGRATWSDYTITAFYLRGLLFIAVCVLAVRVAGVDLFGRLLKDAAEHQFPVFFLGATEEVVERAAAKCASEYPGLEIAGYHHGYFWSDEQAVVDEIRASGARLLFVAITSPKKENFINRWKSELGVDFVMGVGGTFDVVAGKVKRAPVWMQNWGLEWLFRTIQEPRRMWKRYLVTNSRFALMLGKARLLQRRG